MTMTSNLDENEQSDFKGQFDEGEDYGLPQLDFSPLEPLEFNEISSKPVSSKYLIDEETQTSSDVKEPVSSPSVTIDEKSAYRHQAGGNKKLKFVFVVVLGVLIVSIIGITLLIMGEEVDSSIQDEVKKEILPEPAIVSEIPADTLEPEVTADTPEPEVVVDIPEPEPDRVLKEEPTGAISEVNQLLNKYFLVVASFLDKDLANDYADQLIQSESNVFIISPTSNSKFTRVAVGKYETLGEVIDGINSYNDEFGEQIWALKY